MRSNSSLPSQSLSAQSGIALVTVLLFLILIMIIGVIAVRQASVDLNVAASDQVGTLLMNNSDSVLAHVEVVASDPKNPQYARVMSQKFGILGHFTIIEGKIGDQVSSCYRPTSSDMFDVTKAHVRKLGGTPFISKAKACDASRSDDYTSDRNVAMTQIIVKGMADQSSDDFNNAATGTSEGGTTENMSPRIQLNSVSVLPSMSDKSADDIQDCLGRPVGDATAYGFPANDKNASVNDCLRNKNIPATFVVEEGLLVNDETGGYTGSSIDSPCKDDATCSPALQQPKNP